MTTRSVQGELPEQNASKQCPGNLIIPMLELDLFSLSGLHLMEDIRSMGKAVPDEFLVLKKKAGNINCFMNINLKEIATD